MPRAGKLVENHTGTFSITLPAYAGGVAISVNDMTLAIPRVDKIFFIFISCVVLISDLIGCRDPSSIWLLFSSSHSRALDTVNRYTALLLYSNAVTGYTQNSGWNGAVDHLVVRLINHYREIAVIFHL